MKKYFLASTLLVLIGTTFAQDNLVVNGSFENGTNKVKKPGQIDLATPWMSPTAARADVYVGGSKVPEINAPSNANGNEAAKDGSNYAGLVAFSYGNKEARTYVSQKLAQPLKKGVKYCVSYWVSLSENSKYACNQLGLVLSSKAFNSDGKTPIIETAQVMHPDNKVMNKMYNWERVCATFTATGNEKIITIGNFVKDADVKYETNKKPKEIKVQRVCAYYYIDDVVVKSLEEEETCECYTNDEAKDNTSTMIYMKQVNVTDRMSSAEKIQLQEVYFAFGKESLTPQATAALDLIVAEMKKSTDLKIAITGHSNQQEIDLSAKKSAMVEIDKKRAEGVKKYLISKGIAQERISVSTSGASTPNTKEIKEVDNDELKEAKSRRVEFKIN